MGKLKLSKRAIKAVKGSIAHRKRDIQAKLEKGVLIKLFKGYLRLVWADNLEKVECYGKSCPLCIIYYNPVAENHCAACPYYKKYGEACMHYSMH